MRLDKSDSINKKLVAIFYDENKKKIKTTHFGQKGAGDYTINNDDKIKSLYLNRHQKKENWNDYTSAGALSRWILWNKKTVNLSLKDFLYKFNLSVYNK